MVRKHVVWTVLLSLLFSPVMESQLRAAEPSQEELQRQLTAKLAELETLQREVQTLQTQLAPRQLLVRMKSYEVNLTKLTNLGIDFDGTGLPKLVEEDAKAGTQGQLQAMNVEQAKAFNGFLDSLLRKNVARLVSDPTLVTVVGRPAEFHQGAEIPNGVDANGKPVFEKIGAAASVSGELAGPNRVKLDLKLRNSRLRYEPKPGEPLPIEVDEIQTAVTLNSGETILFPGVERNMSEMSLDPKTGAKEEVQVRRKTFFLITAELIEPMADVQTALPPGAESFRTLSTPSSEGERRPAKVFIKPVIMELSLTKLHALGSDKKASLLASIGLSDLETESAEVEHDDFFDDGIKSLADAGVLTILSRPKCSTIIGCSAEVSVGTRVPTPADGSTVDVGCFLEMLPKDLTGSFVLLELTARHTSLTNTPKDAPDQVVEQSKIARELRLKQGQRTLVVGKSFQRTKETDDPSDEQELEDVLPLYIVEASVALEQPLPQLPRGATANSNAAAGNTRASGATENRIVAASAPLDAVLKKFDAITPAIAVGCRELRFPVDKLREPGHGTIDVPTLCDLIGVKISLIEPIYSHPVAYPTEKQWLVEDGFEGLEDRLHLLSQEGKYSETEEYTSLTRSGIEVKGGNDSRQRWSKKIREDGDYAAHDQTSYFLTPKLQSNGNILIEFSALEVASTPKLATEPEAKTETIMDLRATVDIKPGQVVVVPGPTVSRPTIKRSEDGAMSPSTETTISLFLLTAESRMNGLPKYVPPTVDSRPSIPGR